MSEQSHVSIIYGFRHHLQRANRDVIVGAVDIGGTKIAVGLVDGAGTLRTRKEVPTSSLKGPQAAADYILETLTSWQVDGAFRIDGIGVGCTGPVDNETGVVGDVAFLPGWNGFRLADCLRAKSGVEVTVDNDANAGAMAEWRWGAGRGSNRFAYVSVGTGIGLGLLVDGVPYRGASGSHPEFGHHTIDASGPLCYCGAAGCWEILASGPAMAAWYADRNKAGDANAVPSRTAESIFQLAVDGDSVALDAVGREARYLGIGLANVASAFAPDRIAMGGGLMSAWHVLSDDALETARGRGLMDIQAIEVTGAMLGSDAPLLGAAQTWFSNKADMRKGDLCSM